MKLLPCPKHPSAFWPWDKPYLSVLGPLGVEGTFRSHVECPLCEKDRSTSHLRELRPREAAAKHNAAIRWNNRVSIAEESGQSNG